MFRDKVVQTPACEAKWILRHGPIEFHMVWAQFSSPLITPRDFKSAFRIVHRSLMLRAFNPDAPDPACRLCRCAPERFSHLAECEHIQRTFRPFVEYSRRFIPTLELSPLLIYLGMVDGSHPLPPALSAFRIIIWKFALIAMVRVDTDNAKYDADQVWEAAWKRFITRLRAYVEHVRRRTLRNLGLGRDTSYSSCNRVLTPLAYFDPMGQCTLNETAV